MEIVGDSWSTGKGVVRSGGDRVDPLPVFYDRVIATEAASTGTIRPVDALFVSAGSNELVDLACDDGHPGVETHALMAENTMAFLAAELGWSK